MRILSFISLARLTPLLALLFTAQCSLANDKVILQLKWKHQFQFAGFYAAKTQGYFKEEGLDVDIREAVQGRIPLDIVLSGDAQYGISDSSLVLARMQGKKPVILATIFQHSPLVLLTLKSSNIINPLQLKGKKIMYLRDVDDAVLRAMFTEVGLLQDNYQHIPHTFSDNDLITKKVDAISAYITDQPFYFKQNDIPINIISPANYGIDFYGDMIFTEENYLKENQQQALAFRRAAIKGWHYAITHQEEMVDWIVEHLAPQQTKANLMYEAEMTARIIQPSIIDLGYFSTNRFFRIADIYKQLDLVDENASFEGISYQDHLNNNGYSTKWVQAIAISAVCLALFVLILWVNNLRLKAKVKDKTFRLEQANSSMKRYLKVINHYVHSCGLSPELHFINVSTAWCRTLAVTAEDLIGQEFQGVLSNPDDPQFLKMKDALTNNQDWNGEMCLNNHSGAEIWFDISAQFEVKNDTHASEITLIAVDISDQKRIEQLSLTDSLTSLANRRHFDQVLNNEFRRMKRNKSLLSLLMIDVDFFKQFNDFYGHQEGDSCLQKISTMLTNCVKRPADLIARYGGEEFILLLPDANQAGALIVAQRILSNMEALQLEHQTSNISDRVTLSIGVATAQAANTYSAEDIIRIADQQLYKAKSAGRNTICSSEMTEH